MDLVRLGQNCDFSTATSGVLLEVSVAVRRQPADHVPIHVGGVTCDDVVKVLRVSEGEDGEVVQRVARGCLGPVDDANHLIAVNKHMVDLEVAVDERRFPAPERLFRDAPVACDHVACKDVVGEKPLAFVFESGCEVVDAATGPWG